MDDFTREDIIDALRKLGVSAYCLRLPEVSYLDSLLGNDEDVKGIVFGRYKHSLRALQGKGALVATDKRILLIDRKPLFNIYEEITYHIVNGISYARAGLGTSITLETRSGDMSLITYSPRCARGFVKAIEDHIFVSQNENYAY